MHVGFVCLLLASSSELFSDCLRVMPILPRGPMNGVRPVIFFIFFFFYFFYIFFLQISIV